MRNPMRKVKKHIILSETEEIKQLDEWIDSQKPDSWINPLSIQPLSDNAPIEKNTNETFSPYTGVKLFRQLPISKKTKEMLEKKKFITMSEIQRASLPHSLCGRDILGAAKTGSGKTLSFIIPVIEKLYRERWGPQDGVGSIIISPTKELAAQLFEVLKHVGKLHSLSAGLLIGGRKDVDEEKEVVNTLNILVCTPGRLLQHMDETLNFDCSQLQVLVLDEADRILDAGFKTQLDAIISQLPKQRQTLLFSATQTKSVKDLARLSLKDPEYISVHAESATATPARLTQIAMEVPLDQKLSMLWSFIRTHRHSKILVFLSTCKQVNFVYETFKKLRPGIPLLCLHGRMKQLVRRAVTSQFSENASVLFATDAMSRGVDIPQVDWVVQVDCPDEISDYIHRVGRTARFTSEGKSILFLDPSEMEMLNKLQSSEPKIPIKFKKADAKMMEEISGSLASLLVKVKHPNLQELAKAAFRTYIRSIHKKSDKEVFDVFKLPIEEYSASMGLPMAPHIRFISQKNKKNQKNQKNQENGAEDNSTIAPNKVPKIVSSKEKMEKEKEKEDEEDDDILKPKHTSINVEGSGAIDLATTISNKKLKKLKINPRKPFGTRVKFNDEQDAIPPLAALGSDGTGNAVVDLGKVKERYKKLQEKKKEFDKDDKKLLKKRVREKHTKQRMKKKNREGGEEDEYEDDEMENKVLKKSKKIVFKDDDEEQESNVDSVSIAEQEELALKLLSSMH